MSNEKKKTIIIIKLAVSFVNFGRRSIFNLPGLILANIRLCANTRTCTQMNVCMYAMVENHVFFMQAAQSIQTVTKREKSVSVRAFGLCIERMSGRKTWSRNEGTSEVSRVKTQPTSLAQQISKEWENIAKKCPGTSLR